MRIHSIQKNKAQHRCILWLQPLLVLLVCIFYTQQAYAQGCSPSAAPPPISFGTQSSLSIGTTQKTTAQLNAGLSCGGGILTFFGSGAYIRANVTTQNNFNLVYSGNSIPYKIYATPSYTNEITASSNFNYYNPDLITLLGLGGTANANVPMYFRTSLGVYNIPAGVYTDVVTVHWSWKICRGVSVGPLCIPIPAPSEGTNTSVYMVRLVITNDCLINAPNVNFGTAPLVSSFSAVTQTITLTCTKSSIYSVALSDGSNAVGSQRRLASAGKYLNYEIYQGSSGTSRWGSSAAEKRSSSSADTSPGPATGSSAQGFIYRALILPSQATPRAGVYTDSILVNVSF